MGTQIRKTGPKPQPENKFAAIKGHRSVIDVDAIKRSNHERLLKSVADKLSNLGDVIRHEHAKRKAQKLLAEEN